MGILAILGNSVFGSVLGSIFAWLGKREERAELAEKNRHDERTLELQNQQQLALAEKQMEATKVAGDVAVQKVEADAFVASQATAMTPSGLPLLDGAVKLVRPLITVYLLAVATYLAYNLSCLVGGLKALDTATLFALYGEVISEIFFLTNLAVSWWFGARGTSKPMPLLPAKNS